MYVIWSNQLHTEDEIPYQLHILEILETKVFRIKVSFQTPEWPTK